MEDFLSVYDLNSGTVAQTIHDVGGPHLMCTGPDKSLLLLNVEAILFKLTWDGDKLLSEKLGELRNANWCKMCYVQPLNALVMKSQAPGCVEALRFAACSLLWNCQMFDGKGT